VVTTVPVMLAQEIVAREHFSVKVGLKSNVETRMIGANGGISV